MKKLLGLAKSFLLKPKTVEKTVDGIEKIGKLRVDRKKVALLVTIVLAILALLGVISEETFIELFKDVN
tara:strand:+ start:16513 stop:16719 length:207 start_codon:yes stop_codon:yes gene_type:complete